VFELRSWIGRTFFKSRGKIDANFCSPLLIDIGSGGNLKDGWVHIDFYSFRFRFWKSLVRKAEVETDLRFPFQCDDNVADGVYSCHTLEDLYPSHAYQMLSETYRILKPNAWLRIIVPDLQVAVDIYNKKMQIEDYSIPAEAIANLTQNWGHISVWNEELLIHALRVSGFTNISKVDFGNEGTDKRLIKEEEVRRKWSLVIEALKP
jgi:predicted SAM-dependent methyltransferase